MPTWIRPKAGPDARYKHQFLHTRLEFEIAAKIRVAGPQSSPGQVAGKVRDHQVLARVRLECNGQCEGDLPISGDPQFYIEQKLYPQNIPNTIETLAPMGHLRNERPTLMSLELRLRRQRPVAYVGELPPKAPHIC